MTYDTSLFPFQNGSDTNLFSLNLDIDQNKVLQKQDSTEKSSVEQILRKLGSLRNNLLSLKGKFLVIFYSNKDTNDIS